MLQVLTTRRGRYTLHFFYLLFLLLFLLLLIPFIFPFILLLPFTLTLLLIFFLTSQIIDVLVTILRKQSQKRCTAPLKLHYT